MGDRTWTGIQFSGVITREVAEGLLEKLRSQYCHCDDGPGEVDELCLEQLTLDTCFYDEECNYARMEGVEGFCHDNHITFLKTWAAGGGYGEGAELYIAVPGVTIEVSTTDGEAALETTKLKQFRDQGATLDDVLRYLDQVDNFRTHYPPLVVQP